MENNLIKKISNLVFFIVDIICKINKRPRGKLLKFDKLKHLHIMYICVHKLCGNPCYYSRPYYENDYKNPEKVNLIDNESVLTTDRRIWLDGYIPYSKTTQCFHCNRTIDYLETKNSIYRVPATKENYKKFIKPLDIYL